MDIINSKLLIEKSLEFNVLENQEETKIPVKNFQFEQTANNLVENIKAKRRDCKVILAYLQKHP